MPKTMSLEEQVHEFYAPAFSVRNRDDLATSMAQFSELSPEERQFAQVHLQYLQLRAQQRTHDLLIHALKRLDALIELAEDRNDILDGTADTDEVPRPSAPPSDVEPAEEADGVVVDEDGGVYVEVSP